MNYDRWFVRAMAVVGVIDAALWIYSMWARK